MPFRVKKRPGPLQSIAMGFMLGMSQGAKKGLQLAMAKKLKDEEEEKNKRTTVTGLLEKTARNIVDPTVKAEIDKLRFDIATGARPISEAYAYIHNLSPDAYQKPETPAKPVKPEIRDVSGIEMTVNPQTGKAKPIEITKAAWMQNAEKVIQARKKKMSKTEQRNFNLALKEYNRLMDLKTNPLYSTALPSDIDDKITMWKRVLTEKYGMEFPEEEKPVLDY